MEHTSKQLRTAALVTEETQIVAFLPSMGVQPMRQNETLTRYCAGPKDIEALRKSMAKSMFENTIAATSQKLSFGHDVDTVVQYVRNAKLWLVGHYQPREVDTLSTRQREIVERLANDETIQSIAESLGLTQSAVQSHVAAARNKYGFETTAGLVAWCVSRNWITIHDVQGGGRHP